MGKFFQDKIKKDRTSLVKYCAIGVGVLIIIILLCVIGCRKNENYNDLLTVKSKGVSIELGEEFPDVKEYFKEIDDYPYVESLEATYDTKCDLSKVMTCKVTISGLKIDDIKTKLHIKDTTAPEAYVKELLEIEVNEEYTAEDFIESCNDNSEEECIVEFYKGKSSNVVSEEEETTEAPEEIDYSSYTGNGTYPIYIIAKDKSGNVAGPYETSLVIGNGINGDTTCSFGNMDVSDSRVKFPIAVYVGDQEQDCAIDKNLWNNATTQVPVNEMYNNDYNRLQSQLTPVLKEKYPSGTKIKVIPTFISVLNDKYTGLVGYGIFVKVYIGATGTQVDTDNNLVMTYYLYPDASRKYVINKLQISE